MISLCTIVKDEEEFIGQCLRSVVDAVDEMVIVDTGSSDRTVEIAKRYGARVYHHKWQDSFSEARNHALKYTRGEWILHLDADEELEQADIPLLRNVVKSASYDSIFVPILNYMPDGNVSRFYYRRLFRNGKGHYEGIVHNQIVVDGKWGHAEVRIYHHGYNLSPEKLATKRARSERLLRKQIEEEPTDVFARFNLARIYRNEEKWDQAIEEGERALELEPYDVQPSTYFMLLFDIAYCLLMKDRTDEAEEFCLEGLDKDPQNLDFTFTLASICAKQSRHEEAIAIFRRFLDILHKSKTIPEYNLNTLIVDSWSFENKALYNIGQCLLLQDDIEEAEELFERALAEQPDYLGFYKGLSLCKLKKDDLRGAAEVLQKSIDSSVADGFVYFKLGEISRERRDFSTAIDCYDKALTVGGEDADVYNSYGYCLFCMGSLPQALEQLKRSVELAPQHVGALVNLLRIYEKLEKADSALEVVDRLSRVESADPSVFLEAGNACISFGEYQKAIELYERFLVRKPDDVRTLSNLASCYARLGHVDSARIGYRAALSIDPSYEMAHNNLLTLEKAVVE